MKTVTTLAVAALLCAAAIVPAFAAGFVANLPNGDHGSHPPMAQPLSVTCPMGFPAGSTALFDCLHPGYAAAIKSLVGLSTGASAGNGGGCPPHTVGHEDSPGRFSCVAVPAI